MKDQDMMNILSNFNNAEDGTVITANGEVRQSTAKQEKDAMKALLEGLDADQKSVNQMPGTHKMGKATATKHPAHKHFVGASADNKPAQNAEQLDEIELDRQDPMADNDEYQQLVIRYHSGDKSVLPQMQQMRRAAIDQEFPTPFDEEPVAEEKLGKKQSLADILRTMEEKDEDTASRFKRELHDEIHGKKELHKGDNGKFDLAEDQTTANLDAMIDDMQRIMSDGSAVQVTAWEEHKDPKYKGQIYGYRMNAVKPEKIDESASDSLDELMAQINNLKYFGESFQSIKEEFRVNNGDTFVVLAKKIVQAVKDIRAQGGVN